MADKGTISAEVVTRIRRSVVSVVGQATQGSGFFALPNGLVVTSQQVVGYEPATTLVLGDGRSVEGRVVWVDVAKDLAFVMPREPVGAPPLRTAPGAPRLGESVLVLGHGEHGALLTPGIVAAIERVLEGMPHIQIDVAPDPALRGAPLVDVEGRVLGVVTRPRRAGHPRTGEVATGILPIAALETALASLSGPAASLVGQEPTYECPSCSRSFTPETDRCLACGILLPHGAPLEQVLAGTDPGEVHADAPDANAPPPIAAVRIVKEILASVDIVEGRARRGARQWAVSHHSAEKSTSGVPARVVVSLAIDATGRYLVMRVPVARLPVHEPEPILRLLLTLNDETVGLYRLSLAGDAVYLSASDPVESYMDRDVTTVFSDLVGLAAHYRGVLSGALGANGAGA
jgi:hypothetical protein